jgi:hypothetical protein
MKLYPIETGNFIFGVLGLYPRQFVELILPMLILIDIAARCLLIEDDRLYIDTEWEISNQRIFLVIIPVDTFHG